MVLAKNINAKGILVITGVGKGSLNEFGYTWKDVEADYIAQNVLDAVRWIINDLYKTNGENRVLKMIAVNWDGSILPPCGRCREFISQLNDENIKAKVMVGEGKVVTIGELLPYAWRK